MGTRIALLTLTFAGLTFREAAAQQCVPGAAVTAEQTARRREGLSATRTINNLQANQPGSRTQTYLRQVELPSSPFALRQTGAQAEFLKKLNFTPGQELMPGWQLTLDVTADGYWFMIKDKTDPCGFALVSNQNGTIYTAEPIR
jgi:hypothetical protein